jgi:hypothetical protein
MCALPWAAMVSARWSSAKRKRMLGLVAPATVAAAAEAAAEKESRRERETERRRDGERGRGFMVKGGRRVLERRVE